MIYYAAALAGLALGCLFVGQLKMEFDDLFEPREERS
jgi:hypothetical protein